MLKPHPFVRSFLLAGLVSVCTSLQAAGREANLRVVCLGDSHAAVEAGMSDALAQAFGVKVDYAYVAYDGTRANDLLRGLKGRPPYGNSIRWAQRWEPHLVLIAFGTNESVGPPSKSYPGTWQQTLERLRNVFPNSYLVVLGPPAGDYTRVPYLLQIRVIQAKAAIDAGTGWIDRAALPGAALRRDGVHLTRKSYEILADKVAQLLPNLVPSLALR